ncbi:MAG: metallophosphoesterase, partial [Chthoniobacterales bacterium]
IVSSGTSTSTRGRGQPNSFNVIRVDQPHVTIERQVWKPETNSFDLFSTERFEKLPEGWIRH